MSIYGSHEEIEDGVLTYEGSHVYPDPKKHQRGNLGFSTIPPWCIPGNSRDTIEGLQAPWVRLDLATWSPEHGRPMIGSGGTLILSTTALRELIEQAEVVLCLTDPDPEHHCKHCYDMRGLEWTEGHED